MSAYIYLFSFFLKKMALSKKNINQASNFCKLVFFFFLNANMGKSSLFLAITTGSKL